MNLFYDDLIDFFNFRACMNTHLYSAHFYTDLQYIMYIVSS